MESLLQLLPSENKEIANLCAIAARDDSFRVYFDFLEADPGEVILVLDSLHPTAKDMGRDQVASILKKVSSGKFDNLLYGVAIVLGQPYGLLKTVLNGDDDADIDSLSDRLCSGADQSCICIGTLSLNGLQSTATPEPEPEPKAKTPLESLLFL